MDAPEPQADDTARNDRIRDDEFDEWLWDREDRYDVGAVDDTVAHPLSAAPGDGRLAEIKRYRRQRGPGAGKPRRGDGDPTGPVAVGDEEFFRPRYHPPAAKPRRRSRWVGVSALVIFVVLGVLVVAAALHQPHGAGNDLAVATPTTAPGLVGPPTVSVTAPSISDTTPPTVAVTPPATVANIGTAAGSGTTPPANPNVFPPVTGPPRTTPPATTHTTKTTTATTTPPRTTLPTTPPVSNPPTTPPTTPPPKPPPATTVPTLPPPDTTPTTTPVTVPFGG